jgi:hypothetical protein
MWQRPALTALMLDSLAAQRERLADRIELHIAVAGSEGSASRRIAEHRDAAYVEIPNKPLGAKWQSALRRARGFEPDGVIVLGSDNIVNDAFLRCWAAMLELGYEYIGLLDAYQFNPGHGTLVHWTGYGPPRNPAIPNREGEVIGSSRCLSGALLDRMGWKIWAEQASRGLDFSTTQRLKDFPHREIKLRQSDGVARHLGIKVHGAMSPSLHRHVPGRIPLETLRAWFGDDIGGRILAL